MPRGVPKSGIRNRKSLARKTLDEVLFPAEPVVVESDGGDSIAIRPVGVLAQSFDHRAVDGSYSAAFLAEVKNAIETRNWEQALES